MCGSCGGGRAATDFGGSAFGRPLSRRALLRAASLSTALTAGAVIPAASASAAGLLTREPRIRPRSAWADATTPVRGALHAEAAGDVRFALVHHSETASNYGAAAVPRILRSFYRWHISKGWPDIAYNFLVDRYGRIWEGRAGSMHLPVVPSATGGTQGFSQTVCWIGNHRATPPTQAAQQSMTSLLAWISRRYGVDMSPGATAGFVSRGSSRSPAGGHLSTRTIEGHRRMSLTDCPGDAAYAIVTAMLPGAVVRLNST